MDNLKPCPFCGGKAETIEHFLFCRNYNPETAEKRYYAQCKGCATQCGVLEYNTPDEAISAWNRRADGWIPVSERLPEEPYGCLLIVEEDDYWGEPHEVLLPYFAGYDGTDWNDGDGQTVPFEVTHWMPLPAAPGLEG